MFLQPKKVKYNKLIKGKIKTLEFKANKLTSGNIGIKAVTSGLISARQMEAARRSISKKINRKGKVWIKIFPHSPISAKHKEARMGKGKGSTSYWAIKVKVGATLIEICGVHKSIALKALNEGGKKLPVKFLIFD